MAVVVKSGDTLSGIAAKLGVPVSSLQGYSSGNKNLIFPGEKITIKPASSQNMSVNRSVAQPNMSTPQGPKYSPPPATTTNISKATPQASSIASNQNMSVNPAVSKYFQPNTLGSFPVPNINMSQNMAMNQPKPFSPLINLPFNNGMGPNAGANPSNFSNMIQGMNPFNPTPTYAKFASTSTPTPKVPLVPDTIKAERTNELPMDTVDRTHVVQGTPSWVIPTLQTVSRKYNIPTAILAGVAKWESGFDPSKRENDPNGLGRGLFQLDLGQHPDVTEAEAFDPKFAADYAAKLLREGFDRTGTWAGALRYYNGGPNYNSYNPGYQGRPIAQLTQDYADRILNDVQETIPVPDQEYQKKIQKSLGR